MKKLIAALMALMLLLTGCGVIKESTETGVPIPVTQLKSTEGEYAGGVEKSAVYFAGTSGETLAAEPRTLLIAQNMNPAEVAVEELLGAPLDINSDNLTAVAPEGMQLESVEFSRDIANVYLRYNGGMEAKERFRLELAITNTVTDILDASFVCVFYNGNYLGFSDEPAAPHKKHTGSIDEAYIQSWAKYQPGIPLAIDEAAGSTENVPAQSTSAPTPEPQPTPQPEPTPEPESVEREITTILYFVSESGDYILPEARNITYSDDNYIEVLIEELKKGPQTGEIMKSPLPSDIELIDSEFTDTEDGSSLSLNFSKLPASYDYWGGEDTVRSYAALIYTITGFVPRITGIDILVLGQRIEQADGELLFDDGMQRSDFTGLIGSSAPIYLEDTNSDLLLEVPRSMEQRYTWSAKARVLAIFDGPLAEDDENTDPVIPGGTTGADVLSVNVFEDTAYVNLSAQLKEACSGWSGKNERLFVYSIVNTVTAMDGISKVQFLVDGQQEETLAGTLCISDPFLRNYGIIKDSG